MGKPPYEDPDTLDLMRSDCADVEWRPQAPSPAVTHDEPEVPADGFEVPSDVVALGELHYHLD